MGKRTFTENGDDYTAPDPDQFDLATKLDSVDEDERGSVLDHVGDSDD